MLAASLRIRALAGVAAAVFAGSVGMAAATTSKPDQTTFRMFPQSSLLNCLKPDPYAPAPEVSVTVERHDLNDTAKIS